MEERKVLLSIKDLDVKFRVRGRILTAIRGISLDIYENESIAIVGESGSGKSVFTKTFAGMLDSNGYIDNGSIIFSDDELADTVVKLDAGARSLMDRARRKLDEYSRLELGAATYRKILELESEKKEKSGLSSAEQEAQEAELKELQHQRTELYNLKQTYDPAKEKDKIRAAAKSIKEYDAKIKELNKRNEQLAKEKKHSVSVDAEYMKRYEDEHARLQAQYEGEIKGEVSQEALKRNEILAKEIYLSVGRYGLKKRHQYANQLLKALKKAMELGVDLSDDAQRNAVFDNVTFRVQYLDETPEQLHGTCIYLYSEPGQREVLQGLEQDPGPPDCHRVPGPHDFPEPHHHHREADHLRDPQAPGLLRDGGPQPRAGPDEQGGHPQRRRPV